MARYILTKRVYNTLHGRGYKLVCKICEFPLKIAKCPKCRSQNIVWADKLKEQFKCKNCGFKDDACNLEGCVESKPSKYRLWLCSKCGKKYSKKQEICISCDGIVYTFGRKFYDCKCYDDSFFEAEDNDV